MRPKLQTQPTEEKPEAVPQRKYGGATYLLNEISRNIGLLDDLKQCFGGLWAMILSIAMFMIIESENAIFNFKKFDATHFHPYGANITSQIGSELFSSIKDEDVNRFFSLQAKRREGDEYWAYDTTSISSYSEIVIR